MLILKQLRKKKKISQTDLANAVGVSLRTIQLYEKKDANIPIKNLTKIAEYFGLSIAEMYMYEVNENEIVYLNTGMLSRKNNSVYDIEPGKYFVMAPLVSQNQYKQYIQNHTDINFFERLPKIGFMTNSVTSNKYVAFEIMGDSMNDGSIESIPNKAVVLGEQFDISEKNLQQIKASQSLKVIVCKDRILCKKIVEYSEKANAILCTNLNKSPEYQDFELPMADVLQFFNIVKKQL
ncbi:helix-turn-helix domain-containing protein [Allomuricauda sp. SCSIO 65647]|uniref:helix-turn-helix domain-containing protein n=1 Tax=Allomuricauda sp. SCSIO 65647 TaxID=2908843 RepID=UPI001F34A85A|nr:helix-turn-helix transcriptional regulator [Muricauda sp. SCSIO 65647]UJH68982.1 helix-turn-helix domain-containing protein [Muricauda sp. SCSIO 65647]